MIEKISKVNLDLGKIFDYFDINRNGSIGIKEFEIGFKNLGIEINLNILKSSLGETNFD